MHKMGRKMYLEFHAVPKSQLSRRSALLCLITSISAKSKEDVEHIDALSSSLSSFINWELFNILNRL